jgi:acetyl-CoA C-acetyltransferase
MDPRTPVIVGAGQVLQRDEGRDPIALAVEALRRAGRDSGTGEALLRSADCVAHVATVSWPYSNEAALVADAVGASPRQTVRTVRLGGDGPQRLLGDTARRVADGEIDVALISGGEAFTTVKRAGGRPGWRTQEDAEPSRVVGTEESPVTPDETSVGMIAPTTVYAMFETALRGKAGRTPAEHTDHIAGIWSRFSEVAATNDYAWLPKPRTAREIATPTPQNRLASTPYTKLLTANMNVDLASGLIVASARAAEDAGVPRDRWVFPWAGAHARDEWFVSHRADLTSSPAIRACAAALREHTGLAASDFAHVDLYSCFPSAVEISANELGLPLARQLTVTGGLTFAGGPANNYSGHSIATMVGILRADAGSVGLTSAVGWYLSKHAFGVYSTTEPPALYRDLEPGVDSPAPRTGTAHYRGPATVEAYTVNFDGDAAESVVLSAIAEDGTRALARTTDPELLQLALEGDALGAVLSFGDSVSLDRSEVT